MTPPKQRRHIVDINWAANPVAALKTKAALEEKIRRKRAEDPNWPHGAYDTPRPRPEGEKEAA
jgi:hypothetical protein